MTPEQLAALVADHKRISRHHAGTQMGDRSANTAAAIEHLQAEVTRLSTPPDDAEVVSLTGEAQSMSRQVARPLWQDVSRLIGDMADALTRLSHARADAEAHLTALLRAEYERGAEAGWNAARTSVYGICEAIEDRANTDLEKPQVSEYGTGYLQAEKSTAKHIRRAMGSFETKDDDNFLALLTQEGR